MLRSLFLALVSCAVALGQAVTSPPPVLPTGSKAPDFDLPGIDGKRHQLKEFDAAKILVVIFTSNHCPEARAAAPRMAEMHARYADKGVAFVAISGNDPQALRADELGYSPHGDTFEEMKPFAEEAGWKFPYLYDGETQKVTAAYGAQATPHFFIFDAERKLRYSGRMDDMKRKFGPLGPGQAIDAVEALLAGKEVTVAQTGAFGCSTKWSFKRESVEADQKKWEALEVKLDTLDAKQAAALRANPTNKLRVINFWSTSCGPCVAEFPLLVDTQRRFQNRPVELITVSLDDVGDRKKVEDFLKSRHAAVAPPILKTLAAENRTTNNYLYRGNPDELAAAMDPEWKGGLPLTILVAPGGKILWRCNDEVDGLTLRREIVKWLDQQ